MENKVDEPVTAEFQDLHTHFLVHLQTEEKSKNTLDSYRNISCKFLISIEKLGHTDLKAVPLAFIHQFFNELRGTWQAVIHVKSVGYKLNPYHVHLRHTLYALHD
ncbi:hypothetical protein PaeBR_08590 [Paenibacillus sp. BR2-3]|uniref:hypothetical protein n=1 Tax=Paenibacillus sp. BR2-3 TaxID=3048494 RepID=UPI0039777BB8